MAARTVGDRIRDQRGKLFTQVGLADLAGVSVELIRKLEQGARKTASIASLQKIAKALDVDVATLLGKPTALPSSDPLSGVVAIRRALMPVDDLMGETLLDAEGLTIQDARRSVEYAWGAYWSGKYDELGVILPTALPQLRATADTVPSSRTVAAQELLARIYWVTACTLVHLGQTDSAFLAVTQGLNAAKKGDDQFLDAALRSSAAWQLLVQGRYDESKAVAMKTAKTLEPSGDVSMPHLSIYGSLVLQGATASGRDGNTRAASDLLDTADEVAKRVGRDRRDYETYFGPSQVVMQSVDVKVVTEDFDAAISAARKMPSNNGLPVAARARHLADRALALSRTGQYRNALNTLLTAERIGREWIRYQTLPKQVLSELLEHDDNSTLRVFARRLGVNGTDRPNG